MRRVTELLRKSSLTSVSTSADPGAHNPATSPRSGGGGISARSGHERFERLFESLVESPNATTLGPDGVFKFMGALGVNAETDIEALIILDAFSCESLLDISREEFVTGMEKLKTADLASLKQALPRLTQAVLGNPSEFKRFYRQVYARAKQPGIKVVAKDLAVALLPILMNTDPKRQVFVRDFCAFLSSRADVNYISQDLWMGFLTFTLQIDPKLANFDPDGAWPLLLDDFVAARRKNA